MEITKSDYALLEEAKRNKRLIEQFIREVVKEMVIERFLYKGYQQK